tara:strand:- start:324 stop:824 length:501 start_codon:yes stop_codon:yes gene_type:complete
MAWKLLQTETLTVANTDIEITALTENKFMSVLTHTIPTGRVQLVQYTGTGSFVTTGGEYAQRSSVNSATDTTGINSNDIQMGTSISAVYTDTRFSVMNCINIAGEEKLMIARVVNANVAGAGTAPDREIFVGKWENNTTQMNQWQSHDIETGIQAADTNLTGFGTD